MVTAQADRTPHCSPHGADAADGEAGVHVHGNLGLESRSALRLGSIGVEI
jgi:hypothetical protein